jgi:putative ABC transport system permease protein
VSLAVYFRTMLRESRGSRGRLAFFVACLAVGVTAVVAVAGLSASLDDGIRAEARQLLAADLVIKANRPLPAGFDLRKAGLAGAELTQVREMVSVVAAPGVPGQPGRSQVAELKVIDGRYPFYGTLRLAPNRPLAELLDAKSAVVAPEILTRLGLRPGGTLRIGGQDFRIAGQVLAEPDRVGISIDIGPRVFLTGAGLARTALIGRGSRVEYRNLIRLPPGTLGSSTAGLTTAAERLLAALPNRTLYRVETYREAQPALRENLANVARFLGLVALLSLFVGGIGVAQTVRAWLAGRLDAIAVLKCLGVRPREILGLYLGQTALLGLAGSLVGIVLGALVQLALPGLFPDLIPAALVHPWQPAALLRGLGLGLGVALLFSLPPLAGVLRVPAVRVLRRDAEPLPGHRGVNAGTAAALAVGVVVMATLQSGSWERGLQFAGGVTLAAAVLSLAALAVTRLSRKLPRDFGRLSLRHGLAALGRPGAATMGAIVALGLGVLVVLSMSLVERRLGRELTADLPSDSPSAFLIDIQPDQWPAIDRILRTHGATEIDSAPLVMLRLAAINGRSVEELAAEGPQHGDRRWALTREQRVTYLERLPKDNVIIAGKLWRDPRPEVSLEEEFARELGVGLGAVLRFDVQGVPIETVVTSLRKVNWRTFRINFFIVAEPGVLDDAPQFRFAVAQLPKGSEQRIQDLIAAGYPNVTLVKIREILEKIVTVMRRIGLGIRFLGGFTVLAGIAILAGAVSAGAGRRGREVALLKTLGVTRRGVITTFAVEYALIGLVAGVIGAAAGAVLAWAVLTRGFEMDWQFQPLPLATAVVGSILLTVVAGLAASARALERRPIEVLRGE